MACRRYMHFPVFYCQHSWVLRDKYVYLNLTTPAAANFSFPLEVSFRSEPLGWFRVSKSLEQSMVTMQQLGGGGDEDIEQLRELFGGTSPTLLAVTMLVSVLHMLFDFLAFKNDVQFWKGRKDFVGLSAGA